MIKLQTQEVIQEVQVGKVCDVCGVESTTAFSWNGHDNEDLRLLSFVDSTEGDSSYRQMDFCPSCFNKVLDFVGSLGGRLYEV